MPYIMIMKISIEQIVYEENGTIKINCDYFYFCDFYIFRMLIIFLLAQDVIVISRGSAVHAFLSIDWFDHQIRPSQFHPPPHHCTERSEVVRIITQYRHYRYIVSWKAVAKEVFVLSYPIPILNTENTWKLFNKRSVCFKG